MRSSLTVSGTGGSGEHDAAIIAPLAGSVPHTAQALVDFQHEGRSAVSNLRGGVQTTGLDGHVAGQGRNFENSPTSFEHPAGSGRQPPQETEAMAGRVQANTGPREVLGGIWKMPLSRKKIFYVDRSIRKEIRRNPEVKHAFEKFQKARSEAVEAYRQTLALATVARMRQLNSVSGFHKELKAEMRYWRKSYKLQKLKFSPAKKKIEALVLNNYIRRMAEIDGDVLNAKKRTEGLALDDVEAYRNLVTKAQNSAGE